MRVFKLLVKVSTLLRPKEDFADFPSQGTCEERIFQQGNKKLGLGENALLFFLTPFLTDHFHADHIIIQRLDATADSEDVEGVLQVCHMSSLL